MTENASRPGRFVTTLMATVTGLLFAWLILLETGLAHRTDAGAMVFSLVIVLACIGGAWWWLQRGVTLFYDEESNQ